MIKQGYSVTISLKQFELETNNIKVLISSAINMSIHMLVLHDWYEATKNEKIEFSMLVDTIEANVSVSVFEWMLLILKLVDAILARADYIHPQINILRGSFATLIDHKNTAYNNVIENVVYISAASLPITMAHNETEEMFKGEISNFKFTTLMQVCSENYNISCSSLILKCPSKFDSLTFIKLTDFTMIVDIKNFKYNSMHVSSYLKLKFN